MKTLVSLFALSFIVCTAIAQAPQKFSYQSVIRNSGNQLVTNQSVGVKISILQGSATGSAVYSETHSPLTNANGLATLEIGGGAVLSGNFANINWANGPYFVKTETDLNGGSNYTITSTTQLLSVPYALYAANAGNSTPGPQGPAGPQGPVGPQGPTGNGVPSGGSNGQVLTNCNGIATWTTSGQCPGTIAALNCAGASNSGTLIANQQATSVSSNISYTGGGGGPHDGQIVASTGAIGLTATLEAGTFASGAGSLSYTITGIPATSGTASFALNIGGQSCTLNRSVNDGGIHSCGAANVHNLSKTYGTMTDQQDNIYKTIVVGNQEWMAENLKTSIYRNGEAIANVTDDNQWAGLTTGACCYYNNDTQYECPYGKLYNWYAVADPRNLCPTGWHVPTDAEWSVLINYLDSNAGGKLKSSGLQYWFNPNQDATNESGFSGLPGGYRSGSVGNFGDVGGYGYWWSSTEYDTSSAWGRTLYYNVSSATRNFYFKELGVSVRCLRD